MGRFGPFVQIGTKDDEEKPRFAGLRPGQKMDAITLEEALELFKLPRTLGSTAERRADRHQRRPLRSLHQVRRQIRLAQGRRSLHRHASSARWNASASSRRPTPIASFTTSASTTSRCSTAATVPTSVTAARTPAFPRVAIRRASTLEEAARCSRPPRRGRCAAAAGSHAEALQPSPRARARRKRPPRQRDPRSRHGRPAAPLAGGAPPRSGRAPLTAFRRVPRAPRERHRAPRQRNRPSPAPRVRAKPPHAGPQAAARRRKAAGAR